MSLKCAFFIKKFTSHDLRDSHEFNLHEFSRRDLEGIINFLHGYYSMSINNNSELKKKIKISAKEVLEASKLVDCFYVNDLGDVCVKDELWIQVKENPDLLQNFIDLNSAINF